MRILPGQCRQGTAPGDQDAISDQRCSPARLGPADGNIGRQTPWASATSRGPAVAPWRRELMSLSLPRGSMRCSLKCCTRQAERQSLPRTSMIESFASVTPNRRSFVPTSVMSISARPQLCAGEERSQPSIGGRRSGGTSMPARWEDPGSHSTLSQEGPAIRAVCSCGMALTQASPCGHAPGAASHWSQLTIRSQDDDAHATA
jgi:hypothetical protein